MSGLIVYRILCLVLVTQACFAIAGTLTLWRETLSPGAVPLVAASNALVVIVAGFYYVLPTRRTLAFGLSGLVALGVFVWVGAQLPAGPSLSAQVARATLLCGTWLGLHLLAPRAVQQWESSVRGDGAESAIEASEREAA